MSTHKTKSPTTNNRSLTTPKQRVFARLLSKEIPKEELRKIAGGARGVPCGVWYKTTLTWGEVIWDIKRC